MLEIVVVLAHHFDSHLFANQIRCHLHSVVYNPMIAIENAQIVAAVAVLVAVVVVENETTMSLACKQHSHCCSYSNSEQTTTTNISSACHRPSASIAQYSHQSVPSHPLASITLHCQTD